MQRAVGVEEEAGAVLLAVVPEADVAPAVLPLEDAEALLLILHVLAAVAAAVWPAVLPAAMDLGVAPGAKKLPAIRTEVVPVAVDAIVPPLASVLRIIGPEVDTMALSLALQELPAEARPVLAELLAGAVLQRLKPTPPEDTFPIFSKIGAQALRHALVPLPNVDVPRGLQPPAAARQALLPLPDEHGAVRPVLPSTSVPVPAPPLAVVARARGEAVQRPGALGLGQAGGGHLTQLLQLQEKVARRVQVLCRHLTPADV
mmetsp:Transcript_95877/g.310790  ORF Transcript_95877/g.310790 Transcript_95877/m.310790 type:complete len:259 (-) Transcript_95877:322-1098(-)